MASTKLSRFEWVVRVASLAVIAALALSSPAMAQDAGGLCILVKYYKAFIGVIALLAVMFYVGNSMFGKNALIQEIAMNVLIGCVVVVAASTIISATGLTVATC